MKLVFIVLLAVLASCVTCAPFNLVFLNATNAVCNDGTPAGYYIRRSACESGFWCWDKDSCMDRAKYSFNLVSSLPWPMQTTMGGMFSDNAQNNPYFYCANHVYVPYCTSDSWTGDKPASSKPFNVTDFPGSWGFNGRAVLAAVADALQLPQSARLLISGCSAGAQGVVTQLDFFADRFENVTNIHGLADAGWLLDIAPFNGTNAPLRTQIMEAFPLWNAKFNMACMRSQHSPEDLWRCFFSQYTAPYVRTPLLLHGEQYDAFQLGWDGIAVPLHDARDAQWAASFRTQIAQTMKVARNIFSPACFWHCLTEDTTAFNSVRVHNQTLGDALLQFMDMPHAGIAASPVQLIDTCDGFNCSQGCPWQP